MKRRKREAIGGVKKIVNPNFIGKNIFAIAKAKTTFVANLRNLSFCKYSGRKEKVVVDGAVDGSLDGIGALSIPITDFNFAKYKYKSFAVRSI